MKRKTIDLGKLKPMNLGEIAKQAEPQKPLPALWSRVREAVSGATSRYMDGMILNRKPGYGGAPVHPVYFGDRKDNLIPHYKR